MAVPERYSPIDPNNIPPEHIRSQQEQLDKDLIILKGIAGYLNLDTETKLISGLDRRESWSSVYRREHEDPTSLPDSYSGVPMYQISLKRDDKPFVNLHMDPSYQHDKDFFGLAGDFTLPEEKNPSQQSDQSDILRFRRLCSEFGIPAEAQVQASTTDNHVIFYAVDVKPVSDNPYDRRGQLTFFFNKQKQATHWNMKVV